MSSEASILTRRNAAHERHRRLLGHVPLRSPGIPRAAGRSHAAARRAGPRERAFYGLPALLLSDARQSHRGFFRALHLSAHRLGTAPVSVSRARRNFPATWLRHRADGGQPPHDAKGIWFRAWLRRGEARARANARSFPAGVDANDRTLLSGRETGSAAESPRAVSPQRVVVSAAGNQHNRMRVPRNTALARSTAGKVFHLDRHLRPARTVGSAEIISRTVSLERRRRCGLLAA